MTPLSEELRYYAGRPAPLRHREPQLIGYLDWCDAVGQEPRLREYLELCRVEGIKAQMSRVIHRPAPLGE